MRNPLIMKIERGWPLEGEDRTYLAALTSRPRAVRMHEDIARDGETPQDVRLIVEGFACRYKLMPSGRRSIMAYLLPGDFCDLYAATLKRMDHGVLSLTECMVVDIPHTVIDEIMENRPNLARALWWATLADQAIMREWLVNVGQRPAEQKLAHLLCELRVRLSAVGMVRENTFKLPLTQEELGHTLGISTVHVNRVLQHLRGSGLVRLLEKTVMIPDVAKLEEYAEFDSEYLNLIGTASQSDGALSESA